MSFPRYPKYKPSGVEWLGDVPQSSRHFPNAVRQMRMSIHPNGYGTWNVPATLEVSL